jgi:hypothetical protein
VSIAGAALVAPGVNAQQAGIDRRRYRGDGPVAGEAGRAPRH